MSSAYLWFVGIDWANDSHQVCVLDGEGKKSSEFVVEHSAAGMAMLAARLLEVCAEPERVACAIELNRGAVVEGLLEHGFAVFGVNPKQVDRFRDRHTPAGAKDDRLDAFVLADALRTDAGRLRALSVDEPRIIQLREYSRLYDELQADLRRLSNRLREQLHRYFPQLLQLNPSADEAWLWSLLLKASTPHQARRLRKAQLSKLLREHRIRRFDADTLHELLARPSLRLAPGSVEAASEHVRSLLPRIRLGHEQLRETQRRIDELYQQLCEPLDPDSEPHEHRDAEILLSLPGLGKLTGAAMLSEASQPLEARDYHTFRALSGQAPVTKQSGRKRVVVMRRACNHRLRNALYHWARCSIPNDPHAKLFYHRCRARGLSHSQALRSLGDRNLRILIAMLRNRTLYDPSKLRAQTAA